MYELTRIYNGTSRKKKSMKKSEENILIQKKRMKKKQFKPLSMRRNVVIFGFEGLP